MASILMCSDHMAADAQAKKFYSEEIRPRLEEAGHEVQLTTCAQAVDYLRKYLAEIVILIAPERHNTCWETARHIRQSSKQGSSSPHILMIAAWGPEDSPDDPAYYARPEYQILYDDYRSVIYATSELVDWVNEFAASRLSGH